MTDKSTIETDTRYREYLDHGFVGLVEKMGSDQTIVQSARISYGEGTRKVSEDRGLLRYLMRHQHTSPFEMAEVRFHLKIPIFVMRQLVRHRTANLNEYSGRYSKMVDEFYMPSLDRIQSQSKDNKQGSGDPLEEEYQKESIETMEALADASFEAYQEFLQEGMSREIARVQLPVSNYTELYWKCDLNNFFRMLKLRMDSHAQYEIRVLAQIMHDLAVKHFPLSFEAFRDYQLGASTFSAQEMQLTRHLIEQNYSGVSTLGQAVHEAGPKLGLSGREIKEYLQKVQSPLV